VASVAAWIGTLTRSLDLDEAGESIVDAHSVVRPRLEIAQGRFSDEDDLSMAESRELPE
jgi:hypothetical protein